MYAQLQLWKQNGGFICSEGRDGELDVRHELKALEAEILKDMHICFTQVIPLDTDPSFHPSWRLAQKVSPSTNPTAARIFAGFIACFALLKLRLWPWGPQNLGNKDAGTNSKGAFACYTRPCIVISELTHKAWDFHKPVLTCSITCVFHW